ncbi:hypothetical protein LHYA1_G000729 [Lachnellula hyalina]|uniref:Methyltransferase domain-containing protein n=1 Tax=Lachnellula hyalina TaxID=1316788 RepID=A0A8H8U4H6_9HELO|nr:uncharacterized protein LHYA1_G000729 [Lachnellula hyalina]TVY30208.1 hypothetical protein LHYA1_G000729 [Lachnellula hyalina]
MAPPSSQPPRNPYLLLLPPPPFIILPPNFTFLDVGCGPGSITTDLASRFPQARFTGVEPGKLFVDKATTLAEERGVSTRTNFVIGDAENLEAGLEREFGTFDVGLRKSKGGIVAAREAISKNGDSFYPLLPGFEKWQKLTNSMAGVQQGGSLPGFGSKLLEAALKAGWSRDQIKTGASNWVYSEPAEKKLWVESMVGMLENQDSEWYKKAVGVGATQEELQEIAEGWKEWERRDESWSAFVSAELVCLHC